MKSSSLIAVLALMTALFTFSELTTLVHQVEHMKSSVEITLTAHDVTMSHININRGE